ncbi:MAG: hypothetical protein NC489_39240 [Ruminococcus flavefaciens]|nr:hypothetical protein [Ruminococcus flavefaciens]
MSEEENKTKESENSIQEPVANAEKQEEKEPREHFTLYPKKKKRLGKYISRLSSDELCKLQRRKTLYMYLSTLFFGVNLFLKVEGRTWLSEKESLFAVFSLYVICQTAMLFYSVYIMIMGRLGHRIQSEIKEKDAPLDGFEKHTYRAYEIFNGFHFVMAAAEIAVSLCDFGKWGAANIVAAIASAVFSLLSRQVLYKANAGNLDFIPAREEAVTSDSEKNGKK